MAEQQSSYSKKVEMLKALGDETRLQIIAMLYKRDCCVCEFAVGLDKTQPSISQHLKRLKYAELVSERKQGAWVFYSLQTDLPDWVHALLQEVPDPSEIFQKIGYSDIKLPCSSSNK